MQHMHEHLKFFKFVRGCNATVPILNIYLIKYVKIKHYFYVITGSGYKQAPGSFIFSLRNKDNLPPFKAPLKDQNTGVAIFSYYSYGPTFGSHDIYISNDAASNTNSYTGFNDNYQAPSGVSDTSTILAGTSYFQPSEIEVFHIV
jgi:hypothetical protein